MSLSFLLLFAFCCSHWHAFLQMQLTSTCRAVFVLKYHRRVGFLWSG
uniref:Uncharacterized protein n=1 Tax=Rhizophora mucronata TaxID=61149 RepID=A0A2P2NCX9_RHIMU